MVHSVLVHSGNGTLSPVHENKHVLNCTFERSKQIAYMLHIHKFVSVSSLIY